MEEAPSLSNPQITTAEAKQQVSSHKTASVNQPAAGQVAFRLLCSVNTAGGVIGNSGSIIKHLETLTGSKIRFEENVPNCHERVVNIIGDAALERRISVGGGEEDAAVDVSSAQEGLMRVFERVLELEGNAGNNENEDSNVQSCSGAITCRLLAPMGRIGALMGKGGKTVDGIRKSTGAKIRVLKREQVPACAGPEEELIQIFGGVLSVKKALLAISHRLQDRTLVEGAPPHMSAHRVSHNLHVDISRKDNPTVVPFSDSADEVGHSVSGDVKKIHVDENSSSMRKVLFRFLCSSGIAGGVIGKGAAIVKYLEKETGASIKFSSPESGSKERLAIISSLENQDPLYSPAQVAIVRVFARSIEVALNQGVISSVGNGESVSARILVASSQISCMLDETGRVASDISIASGAEILLMGADDRPSCAGVNDGVVQIEGDYENVKSALFQLAGRLRETFFSGKGSRGGERRHSPHLAIHSSGPDGRKAAYSMQLTHLSRFSDIDELDHLGFVQKPSSPDLPGLQWGKPNSRKSLPRPVDTAQGLSPFPEGPKHVSYVGIEESNKTVEVLVAKEVFASVYGESGSNLARLREISGATVTLKDPFPGESSGKVIISGTLEQIQIAQSLLQAFISF